MKPYFEFLATRAGTFVARLLIDGARIDGKPPLTKVCGRFLVAHGLVATAATVF